MAEFLSVKQVADRLGVHTWTVRDWIKKEHLQGHRFGPRKYMVTKASLEEFIKRSEVKLSDRVRELAEN